MKIGVVSDTHNNLKNCQKIVELFNQAGVDRVVHTGDITQAKTLEVFAHLEAPMWGVFGNNDDGEKHLLMDAVGQLGFEFIDPPMTLHWARKRVVVIHDPLELSMVNPADFDIILHGHTHRQTIEFDGDQLTFNPGECAGHMPGLNAIGVLDLVDVRTEILTF
jgi:putative phosphoesterase